MSSYDSIPDFGLLYDSIPLHAARKDTAFYVDEAVKARGPVLELGCGTGRVLIPTARAGCTITGVDNSRVVLDRSREKLAAEPADVRGRVTLAVDDVRDFSIGRQFALITAPFRVVQHLLTIADQLAFLASVTKHLAPGGRLVFDVFSPDFKRLTSVDGSTTESEDTNATLPDGRELRRTYRIKRVRFADQVSEVELIYYVTDAKGKTTRSVQAFEMRWYLRAELEHLLARAGFRVVALFGDFERGALVDTSPEMIFVAERATG